MIQINVRSNIKEVIAEIKRMPDEVIEPSTVRALNRAMASARVYSAQQLKKEYGSLPIRVIKGQMRVNQATRRNLRAVMTYANRRIPLIRYGVNQSATGVRGRGLPKKLIDQDGRPVDMAKLRSAFINRAKTGNANVFLRAGKPRYPLLILLAPALSETVVDAKIVESMTQRAVLRFEETLFREVQYRLSKT